MKRTLCMLLTLLLLSSACRACAKTKEYTLAPLNAVDKTIFTWIPSGEELSFLKLKNSLQIFTVPVGAQDCFVIVCDGEAMLLDCPAAGPLEAPEYLYRLLDALGITRFKIAFNTHPHDDHAKGFWKVLAYCPADALYTSFPPMHNDLQIRLLHRVEELGIPIVQYTPGDPISLGSAEIQTWRLKKVNTDNDRSVVMKITYGERSIFFAADLFSTTERWLTRQEKDGLKADILKLPHHGIGGIDRHFLDAVDPGLAILTNGTNNAHVVHQMKEMAKRQIPVVPVCERPLALVTDGRTWQLQQWKAFSIELPGAVQP